MYNNTPSQAPRYSIPRKFLASVEHPGVVVNTENALASLGGRSAIQEAFVHGAPSKTLGLSLHRNDPYRRPVFAQEVPTVNVVMKITVPRRTGRRRRKGTDDPFLENPESYSCSDGLASTRSVIQRMRDNELETAVEALGTVAETYRFRALPDFQYSLMSSKMAAKFKSKVLTYNVTDLKSFELSTDRVKSSQATDMIPPPVFTPSSFPFLYGYNQNPTVKRIVDDKGRPTAVNSQHVGRTGAIGVHFDVPEVPSGPDPNLPPVESLDQSVQKVLREMQQALQERPIFTRRALINRLGREANYDIRYASQYAVYAFVSGPWRDTLVRYGVDPRISPEYRKYQTLSIKLLARADHAHGAVAPAWRQGRTDIIGGGNPKSHIFDGESITRDGSTWQFCDITDPFLAKILDDPNRATCDYKTWGWINQVAFAKLHNVMREKARILLSGQLPNDEDYEFVLSLPRELPELISHLAKERRLDGKKRSLATSIRQIADPDRKTRRGAGKNVTTARRVIAQGEADEDARDGDGDHTDAEVDEAGLVNGGE